MRINFMGYVGAKAKVHFFYYSAKHWD